MTFANKRVFITGGSSGIGRAIACQLAREGAHVCVVARGQAAIDETVAQLESLAASPTQQLFGLSLDVGVPKDIAAVAKAATERLGGLDLLINNAGITHPASFMDTPDEVFDSIMRVNFFGTVHVTRALLPALIESRGQIGIVSSLAGVIGIYGYTAYGASKFALRGFAESLRHDLMQYGIDVTVAFPPDTDTPQLQQENRIKPAETHALAGKVKPLRAEFVASETLNGLRRRSVYVKPGFGTKLVMFLAQRFPGLSRWFLDADLRRFQRKQRAALAAGQANSEAKD
ncbi:Short-chain dehydrogenase/reductase SDR [Enhygromyxa salina]|uniref:3-dehydrosphinganine reductase n=1 Tax=Enhygromyxa salina TaxID=215803 RepID=A0A0C1Z2X6_9BACT|nr:SDR family oxidoreductase [Enhygromyxa salina]KIG11884.1 Short-chain dehydrogenase/reductase SDR [Enhygromyxa salina]